LFLLLYKTFNEAILETKWIGLNIKQVNMLWQLDFKILKRNMPLVGLNVLCNRFHQLNWKIPVEWLNKSKNAIKVSVKKF
jgi:hypothetical protein